MQILLLLCCECTLDCQAHHTPTPLSNSSTLLQIVLFYPLTVGTQNNCRNYSQATSKGNQDHRLIQESQVILSSVVYLHHTPGSRQRLHEEHCLCGSQSFPSKAALIKRIRLFPLPSNISIVEKQLGTFGKDPQSERKYPQLRIRGELTCIITHLENAPKTLFLVLRRFPQSSLE